jgi:glycosyltransferase involved in cell wall biosynthesis
MKNFLSNSPYIVFSHLRWDFVTQRPQHIMNRLAKSSQIIFVEEPIEPEDGEGGLVKMFKPSKNITVIQPLVQWSEYTEKIGKFLRQHIRRQKWQKPRLWFYSPMFVEMAFEIPHSLIVHDCMDELSAFLGASPELLKNEHRLLEKADIVFTGGRSLYNSKKRLHDNVHCFPSSVDKEHFVQALLPKVKIPTEMRDIPEPRVGFYGVIDERVDFDLIAELAYLNPLVSFVMIGPVVKVDYAILPQRKNIYYLGGRNYSELPNYLKSFDIAMMPFALNKSTEFISPTKTLEFMAAKKPIISTAITDVAEVYPKEVTIVQNSLEFTSAIRSYLNESASARRLRQRQQTNVVEKTSWDRTVAEMEKMMNKAEQNIEQKSVQEISQPVLQLHMLQYPI